MKKIASAITVLALVATFALSLISTPVLATEFNDETTPIAVQASSSIDGFTALNGSYQTVCYRSSGIGRKVTIETTSMCTWHQTDIRMLDKNKNVVWEESGAIDANQARTFGCGSDVCYVQAKVSVKNALGNLYQKRGECNVSVG